MLCGPARNTWMHGMRQGVPVPPMKISWRDWLAGRCVLRFDGWWAVCHPVNTPPDNPREVATPGPVHDPPLPPTPPPFLAPTPLPRDDY